MDVRSEEWQGKDAVEQREGPVAKRIERQTAKLPSDLFLWGAGASIVASLVLEVIGLRRRGWSLRSQAAAPLASFIGMWVPSLLLLGVYNKIVKVAGSDRITR